jgi:adenylate kinase
MHSGEGVKYIFLGPPGAGKGTAAQKLAVTRSIPHISTGDIFREAVKKETALGEKVRSLMHRGELVPDEITVRLVRERLERDDAREGFILDGYPRTLAQARAMEGFTRLDAVVYFDLDEGEIIRRLSGRRTCGACGRIYHIEDIPPRRPDICDACGGALLQREDDRVEAIAKRLALFRELTQPLISHYEKEGLLMRVDSSGTPHETYAQVTAHLHDER